MIMEKDLENVYEIMNIPEDRQLFLDAKIMEAFRIKDTKKVIESIMGDERFNVLEKILIVYKYAKQSGMSELLQSFTKGLQQGNERRDNNALYI